LNRTFLAELRYSLYLIVHPFAGFSDIKYEKKASTQAGLALYFLYAVSYILRRQFTSYLFNPNDIRFLNVLSEVFLALLPYLLWNISNWCVTSLMDGEGSMTDIFKATAYALTPLIIGNMAATILSQVLVLNEIEFYNLILVVFSAWSYFLVFLGMLISHQFTVRKALLTSMLTIVGIAVILFLGILLIFLVQQVIGFAEDVLSELALRTNE
jgi:hypothetical protein